MQLVGLALVLATSIAAANDDDGCRDARMALQGLVTGDIEDVWTLIDTAHVLDPVRLNPCAAAVEPALTRAVSRRDDERIAARIVGSIEFGEAPELEPVLRAGLRHPSPDVRRRAVRAVRWSSDSTFVAALEERFEIERDEDVLGELIGALAELGSHRFVPEFRRRAAWDTSTTGRLALDAVMKLPEAESVPLLEAVAMGRLEAPARLVEEATRAIGDWLDIPGTAEALAQIGMSGPAEAAHAAIGALEARGSDQVPAIARIAAARREPGANVIASAATDAIDRLEGPDPASERITLSCGGGGGTPSRSLPLAAPSRSEVFELPIRSVAPADRSATARCWDAPGYMWRDAIEPRIPAGTGLVLIDNFDWGGERWHVAIDPAHFCWLPESDLTDAEMEAREEAGALEVDVPSVEESSAIAAALDRRGWATWLDAAGDVVRLRLELDPDVRDDVAELIAVRSASDSVSLSHAIDRWLHAFAGDWRGDPLLREGIPESDPRWAESEPEPEHDD